MSREACIARYMHDRTVQGPAFLSGGTFEIYPVPRGPRTRGTDASCTGEDRRRQRCLLRRQRHFEGEPACPGEGPERKLSVRAQLEWTNHGANRTFRFWSEAEKTKYLAQALELVEVLRPLSEDVCFGFGAVLGFVRDADFISHDDDLDLLIAMPPSSFPVALARLSEHLTAAGYTCAGKNNSHFGVHKAGQRAVDVFIGFREEARVSWFPSRRKSLAWDDVFPAERRAWFGLDVPLPRNTEAYLAGTYGEDWRTPLSVWSHPWDISEYRDLL